MQIGQLVNVRTNPATQFTGALAQNAALTENLRIPQGTEVAGLGFADGGIGSGKSRVRSILIQSVENLDWEVWIWATDAFNVSTSDPALNFPLGYALLAGSTAKRIGGAGLYYYFLSGLDIPLQDEDVITNNGPNEIHLMLVNRAAASKTAGAGGAIRIDLNIEPSTGW